MNVVNLIGNLTRDPELRYASGDTQMAICKFGLAVNDGYGEKQKTSFLNVVVFGKAAENCDKYLAKGKKAGVTGRIQTGSYEKEGRKIYTTDIIADKVEFLSTAGDQQSAADQGYTALSDDDVPW